ncbi:SPFH domain-containing protein [Aeromonas dhakensis]|uniref:SPFH domain-containing protein n=1 Tax=Aeromonas dhakensis TaxID=196024 RepID=UPI003BA29417
MNQTKAIIYGAIASLALLLGSCSIETVPAGHAKVKTTFGKVSEDAPLAEGFHFVNPLASFTTYSLQDQAYELENVSVPSQDKFKSSVGITVMYKFDKDFLAKIRQDAGDEEAAVHKYMRQKLLSVVREFGKSVPTAQDLFKADVQNRLQVEIQREVSEYAGRYGLIVGDVFIQDITLDPTIQEQVKQVKIREEQVNREKAQLQIVEQQSLRQVKEAESRAKAAEQDALARRHNSDAKLYEAKNAADAQLYAAQAEAKANKELAASVTSDLLKLKEAEARLITAEKWQGGVPETVIGGDGANAVPLFHMNKALK